MRVLSNYRDYYDYLSHQYGGGDPKICYVRKHRHSYVPQLDLNTCDHRCDSINNLHAIYMRHYDCRKDFIPDVRGIVVGTKFFGQIKISSDTDYRMIQEKDIKNDKYGWSWNKKLSVNDFINRYDSTLIELCKVVGLPVFMFNVFRNSIEIDMNSPNLGKLGVASYIPAEQLYQDLSYFIGNLMHDSPDMMKPVVVSDKDKIVGHGFDVKSSFRNVK